MRVRRTSGSFLPQAYKDLWLKPHTFALALDWARGSVSDERFTRCSRDSIVRNARANPLSDLSVVLVHSIVALPPRMAHKGPSTCCPGSNHGLAPNFRGNRQTIPVPPGTGREVCKYVGRPVWSRVFWAAIWRWRRQCLVDWPTGTVVEITVGRHSSHQQIPHHATHL